MEKNLKENTSMEHKDISISKVHNHKEETVNTASKYGFTVESARDIQDAEYTEKDFIIEGVITPGLNLLAGPKKQGKSMLALNMALCIAGDKDFWGRETEHGKVLYMILEDSKRRTRNRMNKMLNYTDAPDLLKLAYSVEKKGHALVNGIEAFLLGNPDIKVIIIDVLEEIRTSIPGDKSEYSHDYNEIGALRKLSNKHGIAMVAVTHCRKTKARDWVNEISGGVGVTGAADTIMMLKREKNGSKEGKLLIVGRDVPENAFTVRLDDKTLWWDCTGTADEQELREALEEYHASPVVRAIKALLEKNNGHWSGTSSELFSCGMEVLGKPIARNASALGRQINEFDDLFRKDGIMHTKPDPNGGAKGRVHHFRIEGPVRQPQEGPSQTTPMAPEWEAQIPPGEENGLPC